MTPWILNYLTKNKITCSQLYSKLINSKPGDRLANVKITGVSQDPISKALLVTFKGPFRIEKIMNSFVEIGDSTVRYARVDLNEDSKPVSLEIVPLE